MPRWIMFLAFFLGFGLVVGLAHWYLYRRARRVFGLASRRGRLLLGLALALLATSYPLARGLVHWSYNPFTCGLYFAAGVWMGLGLHLLLWTAAGHLLFLLLRALRQVQALERRLRLGLERALFLAGALAAMGLAAYALFEARCGAELTRLEVPVRGLPAALDGFRIAQISDVHVGVVVGEERLRELVEQVNALQADLVVITGDLVDEDAERFEAVRAPMSALRARLGVLAVTGNHEYFSDAEATVRSASQAGIRFLRHDCLELEGLWVCGLDDPAAYRLGTKPPELEEVLGQVPAEAPLVFLYHQPVGLERAAAAGADLMLSGHTHRGQLWPLRLISRFIYPRQAGLYEHEGARLYVSRGVGTWGPPMRLGSPPELVELTLRRGG
ncbi:MAG TPA: metallophosphoesterase [Myxococcota bacterium]|nr:metallophosphoesterase [Myxococcota bacterium]HRY95545.1 metallophosphoesterase [Myxococcota bacterium]HSA21702.1 metallophosphoesterase [Myxococcota bacterium]